MFENTKRLMDERISLGIPGNDVIVYHKGREAYRSWRGFSDREEKKPMTGEEICNLYSCSKPVTCTAALMLTERGLLPLESRLSDYFPEFSEMLVKSDTGELKRAKNPITVKQLFNMTAGFDYNLSSPSILSVKERTHGRAPTLDTIRALSNEPLCFEPGEKWCYSLCHDMLAALVEHISGVSFGEFVKKSIFDPCGMKSSSFLPNEIMRKSLSAQYSCDKESGLITKIPNDDNPYRIGTEYESGGAGMVSCTDDCIKFLEALRLGELIKPETIELMCENIFPRVKNTEYWHAADGYGYGLGVRCPYSSSDSLYDFGWDGAAGSYLAIDRKHEISVFYLQHVRSSPVSYKQNLLIKEVYRDLGII